MAWYACSLWTSHLLFSVLQCVLAYFVLWPPYAAAAIECVGVLSASGTAQAVLSIISASIYAFSLYSYYELCDTTLRKRFLQEVACVAWSVRAAIVLLAAIYTASSWPVACVAALTHEVVASAALHAAVLLQGVPLLIMGCTLCRARRPPGPPPGSPPGSATSTPRELSVVTECTSEAVAETRHGNIRSTSDDMDDVPPPPPPPPPVSPPPPPVPLLIFTVEESPRTSIGPGEAPYATRGAELAPMGFGEEEDGARSPTLPPDPDLEEEE